MIEIKESTYTYPASLMVKYKDPLTEAEALALFEAVLKENGYRLDVMIPNHNVGYTTYRIIRRRAKPQLINAPSIYYADTITKVINLVKYIGLKFEERR